MCSRVVWTYLTLRHLKGYNNEMPHRQVKGFMEFIRRQSVVGLAVGLAIGTQVTSTTNTIVNGFINPIVSFVLSFFTSNPTSLENMAWHVVGAPHTLVIQWGLILSFLIQLLAVAAVIYFVIHGLKLDKLDLKKDVTKDKDAD